MLADDGVIAVAIEALLAGKFLQPVDTDEAFHENVDEFDEETELLHGDDQRVIFLAEMAFHELGGLPLDEFAFGGVRPALRFRAFRGDAFEFGAAVGAEHRYGFFFAGFHDNGAGGLRRGIFERPFQDAMHDEVGIAADGRREMGVFLDGESEVPQCVGGVARLLERAQHQVGKDALFGFSGDFFGEPLVVLREDIDLLGGQ